jgi:peroxiredoxin (alkyl hydroperoxide reductase subunit C)
MIRRDWFQIINGLLNETRIVSLDAVAPFDFRELEEGMPELKDGCVTPAAGPILAESESLPQDVGAVPPKEVKAVMARVGKEAIDFEANAFVAEEGFKPIKLSDYKGKWIVLCFYPGDFTFV